MKKLIAIVIAFFAIRLLLQAKNQQDQQNQQNQQAIQQAQEQANAKAAAEEAQKQKTLKQISYNQSVSNWYMSYNGYLPVHASDWNFFADISREDWPILTEAMKATGVTYKEAYERIYYWSNRICKTGFFKGEFDGIRDKLAQRAKW